VQGARNAAIVFATLSLPTPTWVSLASGLSALVIVTLAVRPSRRFFDQATTWRRSPARTLAPTPRWPAVLSAVSIMAAAAVLLVALPHHRALATTDDYHRDFSGTAAVLVNTAAFARGASDKAVSRNVDVVARHSVDVVETRAGVAQVRDTWGVKASHLDFTGGDYTDVALPEIARTRNVYAVDRGSMMSADGPAGWDVSAHDGLTSFWPRPAEKRNYTAWISESHQSTTLRYTGTRSFYASQKVYTSPVPSTHLSVNVYESTVEHAPTKDEAMLALLPRSIPSTALAALGDAMLPPDAALALRRELSSANGPVEVSYTYEESATYEVEPTSGVVGFSTRHEIRRLVPHLPNQSATAAIVISDIAFRQVCSWSNCARTDAWNARDRDRLWSRTLPLALLLLAVISGTPTFVRWRRLRRRVNSTAGGPDSATGSNSPL